MCLVLADLAVDSEMYYILLQMRETVTVSLPETIKKELDRIVEEEGVSRSDVVRESLRDYLFTRQFRRLRIKLGAKARKRGIFTDQDVFDRVS
jgi:Arc/MetJ-type ribon-helix-helix transcriptional regulator